MKIKSSLIFPYLLVWTLLLGVACTPKTETEASTEAEWQDLFVEGKDDFFTVDGGEWTLEEGVLTGKEGTGFGFALPKKRFRDFHLTAEFYPDTAVNSGIFFRCEQESISPDSCYEANIWDTHPNQDFRTGAMVKVSKPLNHVDTNDKWNTYEIRAEGSHIQTWINGEKMTDFESTTSSEGYLAFQVFKGGTIKFRNVKVMEL